MSRVYGSRVREPRIVKPSVLPSDKTSSSWADLAQAWASLGEAKNVLHKLDQLSPPSKDRDNSLKNHRRLKPSTVHFSTEVERPDMAHRGGQRSSLRTVGTENLRSENDKENVVEGIVLNETPAREEEHRGGIDERTARSRAPLSSSAPVFTTTTPHMPPTTSMVSPSVSHHAHSNPRAVFGPPVSFGDYPRVPPERPATTRGAESRVHPRASERPLTMKTHPYLRPPTGPGGSGTSRAVSTANHQAPIRKFDLPADTLNSLRAKIEQQKHAIQATAAKVASVAPGFHPLPEAPKSPPSLEERPDRPPHRQTTVGSGDFVGQQTKKRKVATVPPPPSYCGFSSSSHRLGESVQWKPNLEKVGRPVTQPPSSATNYVKPPHGRVRKVHRIDPSPDVGVTPHPPLAPRDTTRPGIITTSSWRAGKELTDRILKQGTREKNHSATSSLSRDHSDVSSVSSMTLEDEMLHAENGAPGGEGGAVTSTAKLLDELMSPEEEDSNKPTLSRPKRYATGQHSSVPKKPRYNYEPVYPTKKIRHYDQAEVQRYMQHKQEEKKRLEREQQLTAEQARRERQKRLEELYQKQKKTLSAHVKHKQRQREAYSHALASAPVHIHLQETTKLGSEVPTDHHEHPLLVITPPRPHPPTTSPRRSPMRESASPSISLLMSTPRTSPPRYISPSHSPNVFSSHLTADRSPPRCRSLEPAPSVSPHRYSSPSHTPQTAAYLPGGYSPTTRAHSHSPLSPHTYSIHSGSHSPTSSPGHSKEFVSPPLSTARTLMSPREVKVHPSPPPPSGELTSLLRGGGHKSREERIKELTASALKLKERIAMETKKLTVGAHDDHGPQRHSTPPSHNRPHHKPTTTPVILPGVQSIHTHAFEAEKARREAEAALRIQAAYRGYQVRRSLQWELPSGRMIGSVVHAGDGAEMERVQQPVVAVPPLATTQPSVSEPHVVVDGTPTEDHSTCVSQSCPVFGVSTPPPEQPPWQRTGGDSHSVINIFTRQHEQLRENLAQLRSQKLAELRQLQAAKSATSADVSTVRPASGGSHVESTYTQTFEEPSQTEQDGMSQTSEEFSQDSLVSITPSHTVSQSRTASATHYHSPTQPTVTETTREVSAITPPGSPSFVESFSERRPPLTEPVFKPEQATTGRLSPRSLELKLQAELNLLESVEESMRQLSNVENTRAVSLAQRETTTLAQLLKSHQQAHEHEVKSLAVKAKKEVEEAHKQFHHEAVLASGQMRKMREDADAQAREQRAQLAKLREESTQASQEATQQLAEARTQATAAVIGAAREQMQAAHDMAVSIATAATQQAVKSALKTKTKGGADVSESTKSPPHPTEPHTEPVTYPSDFETSEAEPDGGGESPQDDSVDESTTPVPSEVQPLEEIEGDRTLVEDVSSRTPTPEEDIEEDIDEVSFRELLPSESHRRQRSRRMHSYSDSESRVSSPSHHGDRGEHSPVASEDSFFQFTQHMVQQYMREEELRSKHQSTLLKLREQALREKTQAELEWLRLKKKQLCNKGADDLMPPLVKREKDLFRKLQHEQAEIHHLKEAQKAASQERRLMLLQQAEISKIRRSAQYYREKIHRYGSQQKRGVSPSSDRDLFSPSPSLDDTREVLEESLVHSASGHSISEDLPEETKTPDVPEELPPTTESISEESPSQTPTARERRRSPVKSRSLRLNSPSSDTATLKKLKELASSDSKRGLTQRERQLQKRRHTAETALREQQALLEREQQLDKEEEDVNRLVDQAMQYHKHRSALRKDKGKHLPSTDKTKEIVPSFTTHRDRSTTVKEEEPSPDRRPPASPSVQQTSTVSEQIQTSTEEIPEEITRDSQIQTAPPTSKIPTEYASDTFESLEGTLHPSQSRIVTSTPAQPEAAKEDDASLSDSLRITSVSDSVVSMTSEGSAIEVRIKALREQLRARKEEVRQMQNEQKRKKKSLLRQQEEQLRRKLEAVEVVIDKAKKSTPLLVTGSSATSSQSEDQATPVHEPLTPDQVPEAMASQEETKTFEQAISQPVTDLRDVSQPVIEDLSSPEIPVEVQDVSEEVSTTSSITEHLSQEEEEEVSESASEPAFSYTETFERPSKSVITAGEEVPKDAETITEVPKDAETITEVPRDAETITEVPRDAETITEAPKDVEAITEVPRDVEAITEAPKDVEIITQAPEVVEVITEAPEEIELTTALIGAPDGEAIHEPSYTETFEDTSPVHTSVLEEDHLDEAREDGPTEEDHLDEAREDGPTEEDHLDEAREDGPTEEDHLDEAREDGPMSPTQEDTVFHPSQRVLIGNVMAGTVRFVGHTHFAEGLWVGVELDMPKGRNDGSIGGHEYFRCQPKHGLFAPPSKVSLFADGGAEESGAEEDSVDEEIESSQSSTQEEVPTKAIPEFEKELHTPPPPSYTADFESEHEQVPPEAILPGTDIPQEEPVAEDITTESVKVPPAVTLDDPSVLPPHLLLPPDPIPVPEPPPEFSEEVPQEVSPHTSAGSIANGFVQELSNEAFETMHQIWRSKVVLQKDREVPLTLDEKAERITDELLKLLLQSEANLVCNIHSAKQSHSPPPSEMEEPASPTTGRVPPTHLTITVPTVEPSPPILSPPFPYCECPTPMEFSPPGSPPRHLSQASQARVTAGDKTPFLTAQQDPTSPTSRKASVSPVVLERSGSVESISQLLESITLTTSQCMVPSERKHIDRIVEHAWNAVRNVDNNVLHSTAFECPEEVLSLFTDVRELNQEEDLCRKAYLRLIYNLAIEIVKILKPIEEPRPVWAVQCTVGAHKTTQADVSLEVVQKKVYAAVMRGQLPLQLPSVRFLHGRKRPGGREVDFVDTILIRELRDEEPSWVDYSQDEAQVKLRTADAILDQLLSETVQILCTIEQKRKAP